MIVKNPDDGQGPHRAPAKVAELNTGLLLYIPYRAMENKVFAAVAAAGFEDLTLARGRIFQRIGPAGTRLTDLAEQAQVTKQAAGALVDELERAGYVTRTPDPTDNRARLVCIAEKGAAAIEVASTVVAEVEAEWNTHVGARQMAQLRRTLMKLREVTDPYQ